MKFIRVKDTDGEEILLNLSSIAYVTFYNTPQTKGETYSQVHFISDANEPKTFMVDLNSISKYVEVVNVS